MMQTHLSTGRKCSFNLQFGMHMEVCRIVIICIITIVDIIMHESLPLLNQVLVRTSSSDDQFTTMSAT